MLHEGLEGLGQKELQARVGALGAALLQEQQRTADLAQRVRGLAHVQSEAADTKRKLAHLQDAHMQ